MGNDASRIENTFKDAFSENKIKEAFTGIDYTGIRNSFSPVVDTFDPKNLEKVFSDAFNPIADLPNIIKREITSVKDDLRKNLDPLKIGFDSFGNQLAAIPNKIDNGFRDLQERTRKSFDEAINPIIDTTSKMKDGMDLGISKITQVSSLIDQKINSLPNMLNDILIAQFSLMNDFFKRGFSELETKLNDNITKNILLGTDKITNGVDMSLKTIDNAFSVGTIRLKSELSNGANTLKSNLNNTVNTFKVELANGTNTFKRELADGTNFLTSELKMSTNTIKSQFDNVILPNLEKYGTEIAAQLESGISGILGFVTAPFKMFDQLGSLLAQPSSLLYIAGAGALVLAIKS
jgi:hypothetical protein